ncbi:hypothetical protein [Thalassobaculum sp.]|uniref:hypothetical protein n=1 Tax=Thalassobaculum sp. TaxID=2022740 RepID=UPI0032EC8B76
MSKFLKKLAQIEEDKLKTDFVWRVQLTYSHSKPDEPPAKVTSTCTLIDCANREMAVMVAKQALDQYGHLVGPQHSVEIKFEHKLPPANDLSTDTV